MPSPGYNDEIMCVVIFAADCKKFLTLEYNGLIKSFEPKNLAPPNVDRNFSFTAATDGEGRSPEFKFLPLCIQHLLKLFLAKCYSLPQYYHFQDFLKKMK